MSALDQILLIPGIGRRGEIVGLWVLNTGNWSDTDNWIDSENWNDGI